MAERLVACPWCGRTPEMVAAEAWGRRRMWHVACNNDDCPVMPEMAEDHFSEREAARAWNGMRPLQRLEDAAAPRPGGMAPRPGGRG